MSERRVPPGRRPARRRPHLGVEVLGRARTPATDHAHTPCGGFGEAVRSPATRGVPTTTTDPSGNVAEQARPSEHRSLSTPSGGESPESKRRWPPRAEQRVSDPLPRTERPSSAPVGSPSGRTTRWRLTSVRAPALEAGSTRSDGRTEGSAVEARSRSGRATRRRVSNGAGALASRGFGRVRAGRAVTQGAARPARGGTPP